MTIMNNIQRSYEETQSENNMNWRKLWDPRTFIWISMFFSFLPASIVYSLNYGRMNNIKKQNQCLAFYCTLFVLLITGFVLISDYVSDQIIKSVFVGINIGLSIYFSSKQKALFDKYKESGGKSASLIVPILLGILLLGIVIAINIYTYEIPNDYITHEKFELYYANDIDKTEAVKLADYIEKESIFAEVPNQISLKISKRDADYVFSIVVKENAVISEELVEAFKITAQDFSKYVFNNAKVQVEFCDSRFKVVKTTE